MKDAQEEGNDTVGLSSGYKEVFFFFHQLHPACLDRMPTITSTLP